MQGRIRWRAMRRGMLELDVILGNFFEGHFAALSAQEQQWFVDLLEHPDPQLYTWLLGHEQPCTATDRAIVKKIRQTLGPRSVDISLLMDDSGHTSEKHK